MLGVLGARLERQLPAEEAVEEAVLVELDVAPGLKVPRRGEVRDRVVVSAGEAKSVIRTRRGEPVAGVLFDVGAEAAGPASARERLPVGLARGLKRREDLQFREVSERVAEIGRAS